MTATGSLRANGLYLVQRLVRCEDPNPTRGFDGFFRMEYMGSSEYEFDAPGRALRLMRSSGPLKVQQRTVTLSGVTRVVWFVAPDGFVTREWLDGFIAWASVVPQRVKEATYFPQVFSGADPGWSEAGAWWSFREPVAWALDEDTAGTLWTAFNTRATQ